MLKVLRFLAKVLGTPGIWDSDAAELGSEKNHCHHRGCAPVCVDLAYVV